MIRARDNSARDGSARYTLLVQWQCVTLSADM